MVQRFQERLLYLRVADGGGAVKLEPDDGVRAEVHRLANKVAARSLTVELEVPLEKADVSRSVSWVSVRDVADDGPDQVLEDVHDMMAGDCEASSVSFVQGFSKESVCTRVGRHLSRSLSVKILRNSSQRRTTDEVGHPGRIVLGGSSESA